MGSDLFDLQGKTALVTGSSRGLGYSIARGLGMSGAQIVLNGRNTERLALARDRFEEAGISVLSKAFDVTEEIEVRTAIQELGAACGSLDIVVNNAGIMQRNLLEEMERKTWEETLQVNLTGVFLTSKYAVQIMKQQGGGKIINICSLMSELGRQTTGAYAAAKGGVRMLTRAMAVEWAQYNIQINGIGPGYFITDLTQPLADDPEFDSWLKARTPAQRWGSPEELIGTAVYLASGASDFVNGQIIYVDGGILASL